MVGVVPDQAREDLRILRKKHRNGYTAAQDLFHQMETSTSADFGYALREGSEWEGCYAAHVGRDRYRVIWELLPAEPDREKVSDEVIPVMILRVGPKTDSSGRTIYEDDR